MGLDAPSDDLTDRIKARRRALVLSGEVDPALPGERVIHGRQPGAHETFEVTGAAQARAMEARSRRARASDEVVEMDYTDYSAVSEDADEPFEVGQEPAPEPEHDEPEPEDESVEYAARLLTQDDAAIELRLAGVEAALAQLGEDLGERLDGIGSGFLALAKGLAEEIAAIHAAVEPAKESEACDVPPEGWYCTRKKGHDGPCTVFPGFFPSATPPAPAEKPRGFWKHMLFGPGSGPYE